MLQKEDKKPWEKGGNRRQHPSEDGVGEDDQKKSRLQGAAEQGGAGEKETKQRSGEWKGLDALSVGYFRRVGDRLGQAFEDDEERGMFVENVLAEVKGKAKVVAMDKTGSVTLQQLMPLASLDQVGAVLAELWTGKEEESAAYKAMSCDRCAGHVVESALRQMCRWTDSPEEVEAGALESQVLLLSAAVRQDPVEFIKHLYGSHAVRTLLHVLAGCVPPPRIDTRPGAKGKPGPPLLTDFEAPVSFWYEFKSLTEELMTNVNVSVADTVASVVFQIMLTVAHRKRPKLCRKLLAGIAEYLGTRSAAPGTSPLLVFLKDQASSRLLEVVFKLSSKALLRQLYRDHLRGHLVDLALHKIANFPVQRLVAASANLKVFSKVFDELNEGLEPILATGHMGVIVQLADSCAESGQKQGELMQHLLSAFHCEEPATRQACCLPLFLSLLTHEVYYASETAEGDLKKEVPLSSICYHGSRLVQALARFQDRSLLMGSLRALAPADLATLSSDPAGSHVMQALITLSSDKGRGKILRRMEGQFVQIACSRTGSRLLEAAWNSASVSQREGIAAELAPSETRLRSDQFARHVWSNFALSHFVSRRPRWKEIQTGESKKRKLFNDIIA
ncbi:nucleolar protein 9 [Gadus chalcogrammus]|uniref:nucleolar protein 9 n=1 Tax=Gadus chalcogrammus TaxID=1042646 RepID=UPI0024C49A6A|nr:nucleolar protein 9 [Gadus chalcogrammus]XP_056453657.1 nucleolar protein 9 [Gadus chalcogrammus]